MSGLAGVFRADGGRAAAGPVAGLLRAMAHRAPDGAAVVRAGAAALGYAALVTIPEDRARQQPLVGHGDGVVVTVDGRLDNREELAGVLPGAADRTDAELVRDAYRRWGLDCAARLRGVFALVVWDPRAARLYAARDVFGQRPFFFLEAGGAVWWASEVQALARAHDRGPNEGYLAERLADRPRSTTETVFDGVCRLPMAHALVVDASGLRTWRYWAPDPERRLRYRDPREYPVRLRALLRDAVARTLRARGDVAISLSGGIDASAIAASVAALRDGGHAAASGVRALTTSFPGRSCDEAGTAAAVASALGLEWRALPAELPDGADIAAAAREAGVLPESPNALASRPLRRHVAAAGGRVLLSGIGAEEWLLPPLEEVSDLLASGRLVGAARLAGASPRALALGLWGALPDALKPAARTALGLRAVPSWITPGLAARVGLEDRLRAVPPRPAGVSRAAWAMVRWACGAEVESLVEQIERMASVAGIEERHPFFDRDLAEFALALPPEVRSRPDLPKAVLRMAMAGALPVRVTGPPPRLDYGWVFAEFLERAGGLDRLRTSRPVARGWVSAAAIERMHAGLRTGSQRHHWPLWWVLAVDEWLGGLQAGAPAAAALEVGLSDADGRCIVGEA